MVTNYRRQRQFSMAALYLVIAVVLVLVCVDATSLYLTQKRLDAAADAAGDAVIASLIGLVAGSGSLYLVAWFGRLAFKKDAMGMGDVKLMAAVGAWLGWPMALLSIFLGASVAAVVGLGLILARRARWGARIPFGPYLALGSLLCLFWGRYCH